MNKLLSGIAALAAAGMLASAPAAAQAELKVGGFYNAGVAMVSQDNDENTSGHAIRHSAEIHFSGSTTLDNGLTFGGRVELEGESEAADKDQIDEVFIWISGTFGTIRVGEDDSASGVMGVYPASAGHSLFGVIWSETWDLVAGQSVGQPGNFAHSFDGDDEKIAWYSPRVGGLALGLSYTPNAADDAGDDGGISNDDAGEFSQVVGFGVNWSGDLGDSKVSVGAGFNQGQLEVPKEGGADSDRTDWAAGASISTMGVTVSGNYAVDDNGMSSNGDTSSLAVGATYDGLMPGVKVGITYGNTEFEESDTAHSAVSLGARYTLGPGVTLAGEVQFWDIEGADDDPDNQATVALIGTMISF